MKDFKFYAPTKVVFGKESEKKAAKALSADSKFSIAKT